LLHLAQREQGFWSHAAIRKRFARCKISARDDIRFVNRQPGSGTRVLLDYELKKYPSTARR
jgi:putative molybdopterin biosynthesis protein